MIPWEMPEIVHAFGLALLHFLWQGVVLAALGALSVVCMRRRSASSRYLVRCATLLLLALADQAPTDQETSDAVDALLALQDPVDGDDLDGSFDASDYATALAARALLAASESGELDRIAHRLNVTVTPAIDHAELEASPGDLPALAGFDAFVVRALREARIEEG